MKLLVISLCTSGVMKEHFISYCNEYCKYNMLYCITNDNVSNQELGAIETLNLKYKRNMPWTYFSLVKKRKIKKFIKRINPDLIYVFTPHPVNILIASIIKKYKVIFQIHDPAPHSGVGFLDRLVLRIQIKRYIKLSDKLLVAGEALKTELLKHYKVDKKKIRTLPLALIKDFSALPCHDVKQDIDLLFYGRIEYYKGLDLFAKALKLCQKSYVTYIVGKGDLKKVYGDGIAFDENVQIISDYVPYKELVDYIQRSKVIVMPYRDATGSMTVGQAFYYGKPVIASDVGVFPEYVGDGGLIYKANDIDALAHTIESLLSDSELYARLSIQAKRIFEEKFELENVCKLNQCVFEETIKVE